MFGWLSVRGLLSLHSQHWIGTVIALVAALGLAFVIPRQLPFMVGEISGHYTLQIAPDGALLRLRWPFSAAVRRIRLSAPANVGALPFLPGMTLIMLQGQDRLCFGSTLPHGEQLRLQGLIRAALLPASASHPA